MSADFQTFSARSKTNSGIDIDSSYLTVSFINKTKPRKMHSQTD